VLHVIALVVSTVVESPLAMLPEVGEHALFPPADVPLPSNGRIFVRDEDLDVSDEGEPVAQRSAGGDLAALVFLDVDLDGDDVFEVDVSCEGCNAARRFAWQVTNEPDDVAPTYADTLMSARVGVDGNAPRRWGLALCIPPLVEDEPVAHVLHAPPEVVPYGPRDAVVFAASAGPCVLDEQPETVAGAWFYVVVPYDDARTEACFTADAVDLAGNVGRMPQTCVALESDEEFTSSCGQTTRSSAAGFGALLAVCAARRRRMHGA
jgi:hypothetical protein